MKHFRLTILLIIPALLLTAGEGAAGGRPPAVIRNFDGEFQPLRGGASKGRITGSLPSATEDDSGWADVDVEYMPLRDRPFAGTGALRIQVGQIRNGVAQFRVRGVPMTTNWFAKVTLAVRSPGSVPVRFGLRKVGAPFNYYGQREVTALPEWARHELLVPPLAEDSDAALVVEVRSPGVVELDEISVEYLSRAELSAGLTAAGNLLPSSCFPDGLPAPWSPFHEVYRPEDYVTDPSVIGPSGVPALRITGARHGGQHIAVVTAPFTGMGDMAYTFSLWARAAVPGHSLALRLGPPQERLWQEPFNRAFTVGTNWQRLAFTVKLPYAPDGIYLAQIVNWGPKDPFWIDGVQVEAGERAGKFQRTGEVEVSLQPVVPYGLVNWGEPLAVRAVVHGRAAHDLTLKSEVFDVYGRSHPLPDQPLRAAALQRLELTLPEAGLPPLGSYRLECRVETTSGMPVSKTAEVLLHRVRPARFAEEFRTNSPFGIHLKANREMPRVMRRLGFTWARHFGLDWQVVEPQPGRWDFDGVDQTVAHFHDAKLCLLGIFGGVPPRVRVWQLPQPAPAGYNTWHARNIAPNDLTGWREYCRRMAERYRGRVQAWETWNEPFLPGFLNAGFEGGKYIHPAPEDFLPIHQAAVAGARAGDRGAKLLVNIGAHYHAPSDTWSRRLVALGALQLVEAVSYHSYQPGAIGFPNDALHQATAANRNPNDPDMPVWNTEGGPGPSDIFNFYRHVPPFGKTGQAGAAADYLVRYWISTLASGADKFFLYTAHSWGTWRNDYSVLNVDGRLSPGLIGVANLAWHLEGKSYRQTLELAPKLFAYLFEDDRDAVAVVIPQGLATGTLNQLAPGLTARDVFGNDLAAPVQLGGLAVYLDAPGLRAAQLAQRISLTEPQR